MEYFLLYFKKKLDFTFCRGIFSEGLIFFERITKTEK